MKYIDRDLSWLSFNARILQEVENPHVPLMERLKFVAIFSSNLEEFYKVRVAGHRFEQKYKGDKKNKFGYRPSYILHKINNVVGEQQERLGYLFYNKLVPAMNKEGICFIHDKLSESDLQLVSDYYDKHLVGNFEWIDVTNASEVELKNQAIYLFFLFEDKEYLMELDYEKWGRFITLSKSEKEHRIIQLDDVFKYNVQKYLGESAEVYAIKISRDAELYIDEEQDENVVKKIKKSLKKRDTGLPCRLLFNENIPFKHINKVRKKMGLDMTSLIPGGKYHNYYDFFMFPEFKEKDHLYFPASQPVACEQFDKAIDWFEELKQKDVFLSYPYQDFNYVSRFLRRAAEDDCVEEINITLYRVNKTSEICQSLELAALNGKRVFVLAEVLARFDEESNIYWGERLEKAGAIVKYSVRDLKVHAKVFTIKRREEIGLVTYAYLGTGNLNEKTAKIYADHGLLTTDNRYIKDLDEVFAFLKDEKYKPLFRNLLVAPFVLRDAVELLIDDEIEEARKGGVAKMLIKLNSLEDPKMIDRLKKAADAGVKIEMVIRGICCFYPETDLQKQNVKIVSVVDQFLEHTRIYHFYHRGEAKTYLASADWMTRNLYKRVEIAFPVMDSEIQKLLCDQINFQLNDGLKGRLIGGEEENVYVDGVNAMASQEKMFELVKHF